MPDKSREEHMLCPPTNRRQSSGNTMTGSSIQLRELFAAADENGNDTGAQQPGGQASVLSSTNLNTLPPSTPSSFLGWPASSAGAPAPSILTSVSHSKRKSPASGINSEANASATRKRSCPASAMAMAQEVDGVAMQEIAAVVKDLTRSMAPPPPPINNLSTSIDILNQHVEFTPMQRLDISDFLVLDKNKNHATIFQKLDEASRKAWLNHRLSEIEIAYQTQGFDVMSINE